jgi:hypothetical protein
VRRAVELQSSGRHRLPAGDPIPAAEVVAAPSAPWLDAIAVCRLDATPEAQAERLVTRGDPAESCWCITRRLPSGCAGRQATLFT